MIDTNPYIDADMFQSTHPMPRGLPRSIGIDQGGYERLNEFLEITRQRRKAILESDVARKITRSVRKEVSGKRLPAGEKDRRLLLRLYGDPKFRLSMWEGTFDMLEFGDGFEPKHIPTIEHIALREIFSEDYFNKKTQSIVEDEFGEWPELVVRIFFDLPWGDFAAVWWKKINQQLDSETVLSDRDKELLAIRIFSIATIVDDCRLMLAAAQRAEWLEHELADLLEKSKSVVKDAQTKAQTSELTNQWNRCCIELSIAADQASGKVPNLKAFDRIERHHRGDGFTGSAVAG